MDDIKSQVMVGQTRATQARVDDFLDHGYLMVPALFDAAFTAQVIDRATTELKRVADLPEPQPGVDYEPDIDPSTGRHALRRLSNVMERDATFREVATHPVVRDWVCALLGDGSAELCLNRHNMMIVKPAHFGSENIWHADAGSWQNDRLLSFMYLLDPATTTNGCLEVVPGSHAGGNPHSGKGFLDLSDPANERWVQLGVPVEMQPGDGLFFHSCLLHYSAANRSPQSRRNLVFAYASSEAMEIVGHRPLETTPL